MQQEVILQGVTRQDIQKIFEDTVKQFKTRNTLLYLDVNYLYTFHPSDMVQVGKFTEKMKLAQRGKRKLRNPLQAVWHGFLEQWYADEYVTIFDKKIKPIQISRTLDRVTNELMELIAVGLSGLGEFSAMKFHAIGDGAAAGSNPSPGDTELANELDRIDVTQTPGGGGITVDGSTFMCIGNHDRFTPGGDLTEQGIFDAELPGEDAPIIDDIMGDHSIFPEVVDHISGADAPGGSVIIYQCSS